MPLASPCASARAFLTSSDYIAIKNIDEDMNQVVIDLWPVITGSILTGILSVVGMYFGWVHRLRTDMAVVEVELNELKRRVEGHSKKQDQILTAINNIQSDMNEKLNKIAIDIAKINTTLTIIEPNKD